MPRIITISKYLVLTVFLISLTSIVTVAYSTDLPKIYVNPATIIDYSKKTGTIFTVEVSVANVTDVGVCEFNMTYNSTILDCVGMVVGPLSNEPVNTIFGWDRENRNIWFNVTYQIPITSEPSVTVATIYFIVRVRGETAIDLYYSKLQDSLGNPIECETVDGYFNNFSPYDTNLDGIVDLLDAFIVIQAFGSYPGHPRWNPRADVDHNDFVDTRDLLLVSQHFGES